MNGSRRLILLGKDDQGGEVPHLRAVSQEEVEVILHESGYG